MRYVLGRVGPWVALPAAAILILVAACDQDWPSGYSDVAMDITPADTGGGDTGIPDTEPDPVEEEVVEPCDYPTGTYAFNGVGDLVGPAAWPTSIAGLDEILEHADLEAFYCDPDVQSIAVFLATLT